MRWKEEENNLIIEDTFYESRTRKINAQLNEIIWLDCSCELNVAYDLNYDKQRVKPVYFPHLIKDYDS